MKPQDPFFIPGAQFEPAYLALYRSGELARRAEEAVAALEKCKTCPRGCGTNRLKGFTGTCLTGRQAVVSSAFPHLGEEDPLRGWHGSGTIFFSQCNLRCVFCQNFDISQQTSGRQVSADDLAAMMLSLQQAGCHNINLVTPDHVVPQIMEALVVAADRGLRLPIVYNTSAYSSARALSWLDGVVDIYMPDLKMCNPEHAKRYLQAKDYPEVAQLAILEMHRQVGELKMDEHGLAKRGVLVRHLVMPGNLASSEEAMDFLSQQVSKDTYINIMGQYRPAGKVNREQFSEINQPVSREEIQQTYQIAREAGLWRFDERHWLITQPK